jgi:hypothetical protein
LDRPPLRPPPASAARPDTSAGDRDLPVRRLVRDILYDATLVDDLLALAEWMRDHGRPSERDG